jgi:transcriptional regulator with XRE-family HTH domain
MPEATDDDASPGGPPEDATPDKVKDAFARRLRGMLSERGWTQADLARSAAVHMPGGKGVAPHFVSKYLAGRSLPRAERLAAICRALGVEPAELLPRRGVRRARNPSSVEGVGAPEASDPPGAASRLEIALEPDGMFRVSFEGRVSREVASRFMSVLTGSDEKT